MFVSVPPLLFSPKD